MVECLPHLHKVLGSILAWNKLGLEAYACSPSTREFEVGRSEVQDHSVILGYVRNFKLDCTRDHISKRKRNLFKVIQNISEVTLKPRQWAKNSYWFISMQIAFMHAYACNIYTYFLQLRPSITSLMKTH